MSVSTLRLLAQANNAVPSATVTASSVAPATRNVFQHPTARAGNGRVIVSGDYTGANDTAIDIEIRSHAGSSVRVSQPVFAGAGNGVMTQPTAVDNTAAQEIIVTLIDVGTETTAAQAVIYGDVLLRARVPGAGGNTLRLTITPNLTLSSQPIGALSANINKDTQEWADQRHDFGAMPLEPNGSIPANAPRLAFAGDTSRIYRHYKRWDGTQWQYGVSPKIAADYAARSPVQTVTGTYSATLTQGATVETYSGLVTLYDLLSALSASALVEVVGVIANDNKPNGLAAMDVPLRTAAYVLPPVASDPQRMLNLKSVSALAAARTETIAVMCISAAPVGSETWSVESRVTGALPPARTGELYTSGSVQFTIPALPPTDFPVSGLMTISARNFPRSASDAGLPAICLYNPRLGAKATGKTLRLVWTARPELCDCRTATVRGEPSIACLGLDTPDSGDTSMALAAGHQDRLKTLYSWRNDFFASNTQMGLPPQAIRYDLDLADQVTVILAAALKDLFEASDTPETAALDAWDAAMAAMDAELSILEGFNESTASPSTAPPVTPNTAYAVGDIRAWPTGEWQGDRSNPNMDVFVQTGTAEMTCTAAGTVGDQILSYDRAAPPNGILLLTQTTNTNIFKDFTRWGVSASIITLRDLSEAQTGSAALEDALQQFVRRYESRMDHVRALAGIVPKSEASTQGGGCWPDPGDSHYWEIEGTAYLPVFNNLYYHSCIPDANGRPFSTQEFGFGLRVACEERLREGDTITITIADVSATYPYKIGDRYDISVIGSGPVAFAGGIDGTDTLTWKINSSIAGPPLTDYLLTAAEPPYSSDGFDFAIHRGGLPFALGDQFRFAVETGGLWRALRDQQAWLADAAIVESAALTDGLNVAFVSGASPSFVADDLHQFVIRQPHSPSHVQSAHGETWRWSGADASLALTWPTDQPVSVLGLLRHQLTASAVAVLRLLDAADAVLYEWEPTINHGPLLNVLPAPIQARKLTISLAAAPGMALGWVYAGVPFATRHGPSITLKRQWAMERGSERNPRSAFLGRGASGEVRWEDWLSQGEWDALLGLIDASKADGDAPIVLLPNVEFPNEAALVRIDQDELDLTDLFDFQPNPNERRLLSFTLPLTAVLT